MNKIESHCSFCGKGRKETKALIAGFASGGPVAHICDMCVDQAREMITNQIIEEACWKERPK